MNGVYKIVATTTKEKHWGTEFKKSFGNPNDFMYKLNPIDKNGKKGQGEVCVDNTEIKGSGGKDWAKSQNYY